MADRLARRGILFASPWTWLFLALLAVAALATLIVPWLVCVDLWVRVACAAIAIPLLGWLAWQRGRICCEDLVAAWTSAGISKGPHLQRPRGWTVESTVE